MCFYLSGNENFHFTNNFKGFVVETKWHQLYKKREENHAMQVDFQIVFHRYVSLVILFFLTNEFLDIAILCRLIENSEDLNF